MINAPNEVTVVRLYCKSPGSQHLRKNAAAELATLLAAGWQEKQRKVAADHLVVRLERPRAQSGMQGVAGAGGARPRR